MKSEAPTIPLHAWHVCSFGGRVLPTPVPISARGDAARLTLALPHPPQLHLLVRVLLSESLVEPREHGPSCCRVPRPDFGGLPGMIGLDGVGQGSCPEFGCELLKNED